MPNWCNNNLILSHDEPAMIDRAMDALSRGKLLQEFVPMPDWLTETDGWYDWRIENWGCKWDVGGADSQIERSSLTTVEVDFESPWGPPVPAYYTMLSLGFRIEAWFYEPGCCFFGSFNDGAEQWVDYCNMTLDEINRDHPEHAERWGFEWMEEEA